MHPTVYMFQRQFLFGHNQKGSSQESLCFFSDWYGLQWSDLELLKVFKAPIKIASFATFFPVSFSCFIYHFKPISFSSAHIE